MSTFACIQPAYAEENEPTEAGVSPASDTEAATTGSEISEEVTLEQETTEAETTGSEITGSEITGSEITGSDTSEEVTSEQETTGAEITGSDTSEEVTSEQESTGAETTGPETSEVDSSEQQTATEKATEKKTEKATDKKKKETEKISEAAAKEYEAKTGESVYVFGSYPVGNITDNTNEIYDYLRNNLGLNHAAACGVLANIQCESNFNSTAVGDGGTSYGLCQWHLGRFSQLISWCNASGYDYHSIQGQLGYLQCELEGGYSAVYNYILNVPDTAQGAYDAAYYWCKFFEIPSNIEYNSQMRAELAEKEFYPQELGVKEEKETASKEEMKKLMTTKPQTVNTLNSFETTAVETEEETTETQSEELSSEVRTGSDNAEMMKTVDLAIENALKDLDRMNEEKENRKPVLDEEQMAYQIALYSSVMDIQE